MPSPAASVFADQSRYQVRLDWGLAGLARLAASDVVVVVDVLRLSSDVSERVAAGDEVPLAATGTGEPAAGVAEAAAERGAVVLLGCLRNAAAVAREVMAEQERRGGRTSIAVIAVGELAPGPGGEVAAGAGVGAAPKESWQVMGGG